MCLTVTMEVRAVSPLGILSEWFPKRKQANKKPGWGAPGRVNNKTYIVFSGQSRMAVISATESLFICATMQPLDK